MLEPVMRRYQSPVKMVPLARSRAYPSSRPSTEAMARLESAGATARGADRVEAPLGLRDHVSLAADLPAWGVGSCFIAGVGQRTATMAALSDLGITEPDPSVLVRSTKIAGRQLESY